MKHSDGMEVDFYILYMSQDASNVEEVYAFCNACYCKGCEEKSVVHIPTHPLTTSMRVAELRRFSKKDTFTQSIPQFINVVALRSGNQYIAQDPNH